MIPVKSSNVAAIDYDAEAQTLKILFHGGGLYHYAGVSAKRWHEFRQAKSFGSYLAAHIKPHHKATKQSSSKPAH